MDVARRQGHCSTAGDVAGRQGVRDVAGRVGRCRSRAAPGLYDLKENSDFNRESSAKANIVDSVPAKAKRVVA